MSDSRTCEYKKQKSKISWALTEFPVWPAQKRAHADLNKKLVWWFKLHHNICLLECCSEPADYCLYLLITQKLVGMRKLDILQEAKKLKESSYWYIAIVIFSSKKISALIRLRSHYSTHTCRNLAISLFS